MFNQRHQRILDLIDRDATVQVTKLSAEMGVSDATIRRDLDKLEKLGLIHRVYGGAVPAPRADPEPPILQRGSENALEKQRIGKAAADLVTEGDVVFIGSGTTTQEVACNLVGRRNITVITNALTIVNTLAAEQEITLIMIGGMHRQSELSFIGYIAEMALKELRPHKVIMGIHAINVNDGLTNDYLAEVSTDRVIIHSAPEVIIVADNSKFDKVSTAVVAPIGSITKLITDNNAPFDTVEEIRALGVEVICV